MIAHAAPRPPLTTGWEEDLDPADTVARRFLLNLADSHASVAVANGGWVHRHDAVSIATSDRPASYFNAAVLLQPPGEDWDALLACVDGVFGRSRRPADAYLWSLWPTPDLRERGWVLEGHPPLLVRPPGGSTPPATEALELRRVTDTAALADWERVAIEGYPMPGLDPARPGALLDPTLLGDDRWRLWVGYQDGAPVAIGTQFTARGFAQYALGVTLPAARGRGHWSAMVRARMLAEPDLVSGGVFSDLSRPGMERLGYLPVLRLTLWRRPAFPTP